MKKIKNYILIFAFALIGIFTLSHSEKISAFTLDNGITVNNFDTYVDTDGYRYLYFIAEKNEEQNITALYYNLSSSSYRMYPVCRYTHNSLTYEHQINCTGTRYGAVIGESPQTSSNNMKIYWSDLPTQEYETFSVVFENEQDVIYKFRRIDKESASYDEGFESGLIEGQHRGYDTGYTEGYEDGYNVGFDNNNNTIVGLAGAIFTAPVNMLSTIFNFEILGVNLSAFIFSLITLLVVIWLIKKFI